MSKYFYRIFTIIDLHFGAMQPCSSGLGMTPSSTHRHTLFVCSQILIPLHHCIRPCQPEEQPRPLIAIIRRKHRDSDNELFYDKETCAVSLGLFAKDI